MSPGRRWSLIALAALGTGVAAFFAPNSDRAVEMVAPLDSAHASAANSAIEVPKRKALRRQRGDLFTPYSWAPPPPPPQPVQQEVAPQPPPNPYRFAGTVEYGGSRRILLTRDGSRLFEVKEGEVLEPGFRVQAVAPQAVTLLYEPLNTPMTVALVFPETPPPPATVTAGNAVPKPAAAGATAPPVPKH
jgi:hypothetical protein